MGVQYTTRSLHHQTLLHTQRAVQRLQARHQCGKADALVKEQGVSSLWSGHQAGPHEPLGYTPCCCRSAPYSASRCGTSVAKPGRWLG